MAGFSRDPSRWSEPPLSPILRILALAAALGLALVASAFALAPYSCEGGFTAYLLAGGLALGGLAALPWVLAGAPAGAARLGFAAMLVIAGAGVWLAAFEAAELRWLCRLW